MKKILNDEISVINTNESNSMIKSFPEKLISPSKKIYFYCFIFIFILFFAYIISVFIFLKIKLNKSNELIITNGIKEINNIQSTKTNIDLNDEFFMAKEVRDTVFKNNITKVETLAGGRGNIGNALIMLNNLINVCEKIRCKNIIVPKGLEKIIKNPIVYKEYNITIFPYSYRNKLKIDITLSKRFIFWFTYKKKPHEIRLKIIREEVLNNIPIYNANQSDLYINIRSGDIFINTINKIYSQPPLCFYQKIINENNYSNIFIVSNGHENPVVDKLLALYPKIKYLHGTVEYDISILINVYNLVMPLSSFPMNLIFLNNNLKNLYIYPLITYILKDINYTVHKMQPSDNYLKIMKFKWKKTKQQLDLMITENCSNTNFESFTNQNLSLLYK